MNGHKKKGWIRLWRSDLDDPYLHGNPNRTALWVELLASASYEEEVVETKEGAVTLHPGDMITGRKQLSSLTGVKESTVERSLKGMVAKGMIKRDTRPHFSIVTILNWSESQKQGSSEVKGDRNDENSDINRGGVREQGGGHASDTRLVQRDPCVREQQICASTPSAIDGCDGGSLSADMHHPDFRSDPESQDVLSADTREEGKKGKKGKGIPLPPPYPPKGGTTETPAVLDSPSSPDCGAKPIHAASLFGPHSFFDGESDSRLSNEDPSPVADRLDRNVHETKEDRTARAASLFSDEELSSSPAKSYGCGSVADSAIAEESDQRTPDNDPITTISDTTRPAACLFPPKEQKGLPPSDTTDNNRILNQREYMEEFLMQSFSEAITSVGRKDSGRNSDVHRTIAGEIVGQLVKTGVCNRDIIQEWTSWYAERLRGGQPQGRDSYLSTLKKTLPEYLASEMNGSSRESRLSA